MKNFIPSPFFHVSTLCLAALLWLSCSDTSEKPIPIPHPPPAIATQEGNASSEIFGKVFFAGEAPQPRTWSLANDRACRHAGQSEIAAEEFIVNANATLQNVFVYVSNGLGARQFPVPPDSIFLNQRGCRYVPHVFGVQTGQVLVLLNNDSTFHNVFAAAKVNRPFNLGMTLSVRKLARTFTQPEIMIPFRCNVHPWMASYAGVLNHPFYSVTDSTGAFRLGKLPPGTYEVTAWHERLGRLQQSIELRDGANQELAFKFESH